MQDSGRFFEAITKGDASAARAALAAAPNLVHARNAARQEKNWPGLGW